MGRAPPEEKPKENGRLRFRILCKRCNSYLHTSAFIAANEVRFTCERCGIDAKWNEEIT